MSTATIVDAELSPGEAFVLILETEPEIVALREERIFSMLDYAEMRTASPFQMYDERGKDISRHLGGVNGVRYCDLDLFTFAETAIECRRLAALSQRTLEGFNGTVESDGKSLEILFVHFTEERFNRTPKNDAGDRGIPQMDQTYRVGYRVL